MAKLSTKDLVSRIDKAWRTKERWDVYLGDVYSLSCPGRNKFNDGLIEGQDVSDDIFDSTLEHSLNRLANRIVADLFPPFQDWARYIPGNTAEVLGKDQVQELTAKLEAATAVVMASLKNTNFAQAVHECILDFAHGQGVMLVLDQSTETGSLMEFVAVNPSEVALDHGPHGRVWGIFRKHDLTPRQVEATWPKAKAGAFPEGWKEKIDAEFATDLTVKVDEAFYYAPEDKIWCLAVVIREKVGDKPTIIFQDTYKTTRWLTPRWTRFTGEAWGRGPVLQAFPTARSLNKAKELLLINGSVQLQPPISYIDDGVFNPAHFDLSPLSLNAVGYNRGGPRGATLEKMDLGGDLNMAQFIFEEMQMDIKKIMLDDQLPPDAGSVRSATEWTARQKELSDSKQAPFARFYAEFTRPLMGIMLDIHQQAGLIDKQLSLDGHITDVQVTSPFAQAENINEVNTMAQFMELIAPLGEEVVRLEVKVEDVPKYYTKRMGLPSTEVLRSPEEKQQLMEQAAKAQQAQIEQEHAMAMEEKQGGQQTGTEGVESPQ